MSSRPDDVVDVVVIGAGATGVAAARAAAASLGSSGGQVVLVGDVAAGGAGRLLADGGVLLECATRGLSWSATVAHLRSVRSTVEGRCRSIALRREGVEVLTGRARLLADGQVAVEGVGPSGEPAPGTTAVIRARRIVVATGDEPAATEITGLAQTQQLTAGSLVNLAQLPPTMVVVGGGAEGCELAQALARFRVHVTVMEAADRLLPNESPDASAMVTSALRADDVRVVTGSAVVRVAPTLDGGAWVGTSAGDVAADGLLLAVGRRASVAGLDLPAAGVRLDAAGWIQVDETLATTGEGIFAAGHVTGRLPHGPADLVMARIAGENAAAKRAHHRWSARGTARVVRTDPPYASVGLNPVDAGSVPGARISDWPLRQLDRALVADAPAGVLTLVAGPRRGRGGFVGRQERSSRLLGASIVGPQAGELADLVALALSTRLSVEDLARAPLSGRTWGTALQYAAAGFAEDAENGP